MNDDAGLPAAPRPGRRRRLVYIGGYGRSGSTLFGRVMAQRRGTLYLGEVVRTARRLQRWKKDLRCTCGHKLRRCPVWRNVPTIPAVKTPRNVDRQTHLMMLEAVMGGTEHNVFVNSSKTALRQAFAPGYLKRHLDVDFTFVHLVRDPRGVVWSFLRDRVRKNQPPSFWADLSKTVKVSLAWSAANVTAEIFGLRNRSSYVRVRYDEALVLGVPEALTPLMPRGPLNGRLVRKNKQNHHALAGNRMRYVKGVTIALDEDWRTSFSPVLSALTTAICFPLLLRYRFFRRPMVEQTETQHETRAGAGQ